MYILNNNFMQIACSSISVFITTSIQCHSGRVTVKAKPYHNPKVKIKFNLDLTIIIPLG
jgi:hypothetical protein